MPQQAEKKITLKPLGNRVLAQRLEQEEKMKGGIILPDSAKKKQETAKVVAEARGIPVEELAEATAENAARFFSFPKQAYSIFHLR